MLVLTSTIWYCWLGITIPCSLYNSVAWPCLLKVNNSIVNTLSTEPISPRWKTWLAVRNSRLVAIEHVLAVITFEGDKAMQKVNQRESTVKESLKLRPNRKVSLTGITSTRSWLHFWNEENRQPYLWPYLLTSQFSGSYHFVGEEGCSYLHLHICFTFHT